MTFHVCGRATRKGRCRVCKRRRFAALHDRPRPASRHALIPSGPGAGRAARPLPRPRSWTRAGRSGCGTGGRAGARVGQRTEAWDSSDGSGRRAHMTRPSSVAPSNGETLFLKRRPSCSTQHASERGMVSLRARVSHWWHETRLEHLESGGRVEYCEGEEAINGSAPRACDVPSQRGLTGKARVQPSLQAALLALQADARRRALRRPTDDLGNAELPTCRAGLPAARLGPQERDAEAEGRDSALSSREI